MPSKGENRKHADGTPRKRRADQALRAKPIREEMLAPSATLRVQRAIADPDEANPRDILALQRIAGNRAVSGLIQTKLAVSPVDDAYEREADRVAEQVMTMTTPPVPSPTAAGEAEKGSQPVHRQAPVEEEELQTKPLLQRQEEEEELQMKPVLQRQEEEEELQMKPLLQRQAEEEEELQMKPLLQRQEEEEEEEEEEIQTQPAGSHTATVSDNLETEIRAARGNGQPLSGIVRGPMERAFGVDFRNVRVHTDREADALSQRLSARAFTTGKDVFFRAGEYSPGSDSGRELIAHELTHVVQQTGGIQPRHDMQETGQVAQVEGIAEGAIRRKTQDLPLYKRFTHVRYSKSIQDEVDELAGLIRSYNSLPLQDTNYDLQLGQLEEIRELAGWLYEEVEESVTVSPSGRGGTQYGFLYKPGTWRSLGGPFRRHYYKLLNRLLKLASRKDAPYKGAVNKEIEAVEQQKEQGFEINA